LAETVNRRRKVNRRNGWDTTWPPEERPYSPPQPTGLDAAKASIYLKLGLSVIFLLGFSLLGGALTLASSNWQPVSWVGGEIAAWSFLKGGPVAGLVVAGLVLIVWSWHDFINALERWTGRDLNRDGSFGGAGHVVLLNAARAGQPAPEDVLRTELAEFIRGCAVDTSLRRWEKDIGRAKYQEWRDELLAAGWAAWNDPDQPRQGWHLTAAPEDVIAALA